MMHADEIMSALPRAEEGDLTVAVRLRISEDMETQLNAIEALLRGAGHRHMNRSVILRALIAKSLADLTEAP